MSRPLAFAGVGSKVAWLAALALDQADTAALGVGVIVVVVSLLPAAYHLIDRFLDRIMQLPSDP